MPNDDRRCAWVWLCYVLLISYSNKTDKTAYTTEKREAENSRSRTRTQKKMGTGTGLLQLQASRVLGTGFCLASGMGNGNQQKPLNDSLAMLVEV